MNWRMAQSQQDRSSSSSAQEHRTSAPGSVRCAVLTISDTRTQSDDHSGGKIIEALRGAGHEVPLYRIVKDDPSEIRDAMREAAATKSIQAVLINGGTGIAPRDRTF